MPCPALLQYVGAVNTVFGRAGALWLGFFQYINLVFTCAACECIWEPSRLAWALMGA